MSTPNLHVHDLFVGPRTKSLWQLILCLMFFLSLSCVGADEGGDLAGRLRAKQLKDFFAPKIAVEEIESIALEKPKVENFTEYEISGNSSSKFFADVSSLTIGEDGVIRLALGVRSISGAWSLTYEGFRCETYEYRIYGTSRGFDNEWKKNKRSKWTFARYGDAGRMRFELARYYLCHIGSINPLTEISELLEKGRLKIKTDRGAL
jgi:hypothetical protein